MLNPAPSFDLGSTSECSVFVEPQESLFIDL